MESIKQFLEKRKQADLLRTLRPAQYRKAGKIYIDGAEYFDFSSNDYLGLAEHPALKDAAVKAIEKFGTSSSASRLLSGDLQITHQLEEKVANLKGKESALVFNSGYQANTGIISALYKTGDAVFCDKFSHASIIDAIALSGARLYRFGHNDSEHLEKLLKKTDNKFKNRLIVTESIFSMDGDRAPLKALVKLKEKYNCQIMVDEAHATGIFAKNGSGVVTEENLADKIDLIMGTFGKALGSFGAYLACSEQIKQYLINTCRSFIYSTALPPCVIATNIAALDLLEKEPFRRKELLENAAYFRSKLAEKKLKTIGQSQIVPLIEPDSKKLLELSERLKEKGFWALPIRPPTVPAGFERLRFSLSYSHSSDVLNELLQEIYRVYNV